MGRDGLLAATIGTLNPFRYRGCYDGEVRKSMGDGCCIKNNKSLHELCRNRFRKDGLRTEMKYLRKKDRIIYTLILLAFVMIGIMILISTTLFKQSVWGTNKWEPNKYRNRDLYLNSLKVESNSTIQEITDRFGEPLKISEEKNGGYTYYGYEYEDQVFYFAEGQYRRVENEPLFAIEIKSNELLFGREKIGIGSPHEKILKVLGEPDRSTSRKDIITDVYNLFAMSDGSAVYSGWTLSVDFQDEAAISIWLQHSY